MSLRILSLSCIFSLVFFLGILAPAADAAGSDDDYPEEEFFAPSDDSTEQAPVDNRPPMFGTQMTPPPTHAQEVNGTNPDQGIYVRKVFSNTAASDMGVQPGDIVLSMNGTDIDSMQTLRDIVSDSKVGDKVSVTVVRKGNLLDLDGKFQPWLTSVPKTKLDNNAEKRYRDMQRSRLERRMGKATQRQQKIQQQIAQKREQNKKIAADDLARMDSANIKENLKSMGYPDIALPKISLPGTPFTFSWSMNVDHENIPALSDEDIAQTHNDIEVNPNLAFFALLAPNFSAQFHMDVNKNISSNEL